MQEFRFDKLEDARNEAGFLGCTIGDIGTTKDPILRKLLNDASKYQFAMIEKLKEALAVAREKGLEEPKGHLGYTSKDGEDFENQEVDRMSEDYSAKVESEAMDWVDDHEREIANHFEAFEPW